MTAETLPASVIATDLTTGLKDLVAVAHARQGPAPG